MKIVLISQSYPPMISGAAIMVQHLAQGLAADGHEVLVLAASDSGESYTKEAGRLRVLRLASIYNPVRAKQRFLFAPLPAMRRAIAAFQPDVIHTHEPLSLGLCGLKIAREMQQPTILTLHQLPWFPAMYLPAWPGLLLADGRDVRCDDTDLESAQARQAERVAAAIQRGALPIGIGGGHEIAFATYRGIVQSERKIARLGILNFDAHFDLRRDERATSGTPFLQALVDALYAGRSEQFIETQVKFEDGRTGSVSATLQIRDAKTFAPVRAAA